MNDTTFPNASTAAKPINFTTKQVSEALDLSVNYLRRLEDELGLQIQRVLRGSVEVRSYTPEDLFTIQAKRRERGQLKGLPKPLVLSVYVKKGGTAKTSITVNLAIQLQMLGFKVLVIDNDPQGDCTTMFGYDPDRTAKELEEEGISPDRAVDGHFGNLIAPEKSRINQMALDQIIKKPYGEYGPHLIPAEESLEDLSSDLQAMLHADLRYGLFLSKALKGEIPHCNLSKYDVVILDNNPAGTPISRNAMVACDMMICPIRFDKFSFRALNRLANMFNEFAAVTGRAPEMVAIPTMFVRQRPRMQRNLADMRDLLHDNVTQEQLHMSEDYAKSLEDGIPLSFYKDVTPLSINALRAVTAEISERMKNLSGSK
ncbi:AAA family ATPase [Chromobacterium piscinae]|uniref:AAA family ATPase n=1 Tax=Chromobacterium amazonense TaxID=1382803 RepID=UPI0009FD0E2B